MARIQSALDRLDRVAEKSKTTSIDWGKLSTMKDQIPMQWQWDEAKQKAVDKSKEMAKEVDAKAHENPWVFVAVAAVFSLIFGFFMGRKSK